MSTLPTVRRHHGYEMVREAILGVARDIMRAEGVGALSLNEVARRVGMKPPSLYTYFASKHALYDELFRGGMRMYRRRLTELLESHGLTAEVIPAAIADYMAFADENPDLYALLFERPVPGFVPSEESMVEARGLLEDGERWWQQALDAGIVRSGLDAAATRDLVLGLMHGLTSLKRANEPDAPIGSGRFSPLIPAAAGLIEAAWVQRQSR
ncbi:MAG: TetR/AcrR family transcriptional regulator [Dehalococcoidia bacterium]|nr:TetR/AcrR family transcriptional regulator [Dehalococcoidia bacterium]